MQTLGCVDIDVMRVDNMDQNIQGLSDKDNVPNVIPDRPGVWTPEPWDILPLLRIQLPPVKGVQPGDYNITWINITAQPFDNVTVLIQDADGKYIFIVSFV